MKINKKTKRYTVFTLLATSAATGMGMGTYYLWGGAASVWELIASVGLGLLASRMLASKGSHEGMSAAGGIVCAMASTTLAIAGVSGWAGGGQQTPVAWLVGGAIYASLAWTWTRHVRWEKMEMKHRWVKIKNERYAGKANFESKELALQLRQLQLELKQAQMGKNQAEPIFSAGPVGTLQRVVWKRYNTVVEPLMVTTGAGWVAETQLVNDLTLGHMSRMVPDFEAALDLPGTLKVVQGSTGGVVNIVYAEPISFPNEVPYDLFEVRTWDSPVVLGIDSLRRYVELDLSIHAAVAGATNYGKSTLINSLILQLAERECVKVIGVDMKPFAPEFSPLRPILHDLVTDLVGAHDKLDWVSAEMYRRGRVMQQNGWKKWRPTEYDPVYYVIIDEYAELIRQDKSAKGKKKIKTGDSIQDKVESILAMARAYGLILILCTQQPSAKLFGTDTSGRGNLPIRISFTMTEANHDRYVLPTSGGWSTQLLDGFPGRFLLFSSKHRTPQPYLSYWVGEEFLTNEVHRISEVLKERDQAPLDLTKSDKSVPEYEEMPAAILAQLALTPMTKRALAEHFGVAVDDWKLKQSLNDLSQDKEIQVDARNIWRLVD